MKKIFKISLITLFIIFSSITFQKAVYPNDCSQGYRYVVVYENNQRWIYVYCGDTLIERYIDDDYIPEK